jgi:cytochrome c peroxidase
MHRAKIVLIVMIGPLPMILTASLVVPAGPSTTLSPIELLGKQLFFDNNLSTPHGQACAACHGPEVGFTGPISQINASTAVYPGAVARRFGNRKPPAAAYAGDSPMLHYDAAEEVWVGGVFWDGRATGWRLGDPLAEQAQGPFLNELEQNNPNSQIVCNKVRMSAYAPLFRQVWGANALDCVKDVAGTYERIARSIAAYERSREVNPFSSKFDAYLRGEAVLTPEEEEGMALFNGKGQCSACHVSEGDRPVFTDFTFDNLGVPRNPANPFYRMPRRWNPMREAWADMGLGGFLKAQGYPAEVYEPELGKVRVPSLRNVDLRPHASFVKTFAHNGYFKSLKAIVHFYNTRDVLPVCSNATQTPGVDCWPEPEVSLNVNRDELGNLGLTDAEEDAIVAFMKTLSDGYVPEH